MSLFGETSDGGAPSPGDAGLPDFPVPNHSMVIDAQALRDRSWTSQIIDELSMHTANDSPRSVDMSRAEKLISIVREFVHAREMQRQSSSELVIQIGTRLKMAREALGLSQTEVFSNLGVGKTLWNNYERGIRKQDPLILTRFCNAYGITLDWLYRGEMGGLRSDLVPKLLKIQAAVNQ